MKGNGFIEAFSCLKREKGTKTTIMSRFLRLSIISMSVVALCVFLYFYIQFTNVLTANYIEQAQTCTRMSSSTVAQWTDLIRQQIENQTDNAELVDEGISLAKRKSLLQDAADKTKFNDFSISFADGKTYNDTVITDRDYFVNAQAGETYISSPIVRKTDNSIAIMVGSKMKVSGFDGIIYGAIDNNFFSELLDDCRIGESGYGFIIDSKGTIIAHPDSEIVENQVNPIEMAKDDETYTEFSGLIKEMLTEDSGSTTVNMPDGQKYIIAYEKIPGNENWVVATAILYNEAILPVNKALNVGVYIIIGLVIIEFFVNLSIASGIAIPVRKASEALKKISIGEINEEFDFPKTKNDETGILIESLIVTKKELNTYIGEISEVLRDISEGELDVNICREYVGDFVEIKNSLVLILDALNNTFMNAQNASSNLLEGARQVEGASQALASASTEQASAVVEITASIEGIARSTADNSRDVLQVNNLTQTAKNKADNGNNQMHKMIAAMNDINNSSQNISRIMKVIDDIAFQTNILALNASVEAARAGEHGRGFSVVAEEVRSLAGKSAEAANEISEMIDDTIRKIQTGTNIASETADELDHIVVAIDEVANIMVNIAEVSKAQAISIDQINSGIEQISAAVQNNSATSEECAASSIELSDHAEGMLRQTQFYHLR